MTSLRGPILLSAAAAVVNIVLKTAAYLLTGSVGLFSDALESGVNLLAAGTAYVALIYSARPADPTHAFGHEKIEFFSAGLEGVLVTLAGLGTGWYAVQKLLRPTPLDALGLGVGLAAAAAVVNLLVGRYVLRVGRAHGSLLLEADGHHLMTDVWTTAAVVAGLGLVQLTGVTALDALCGLGVSVHIVVVGCLLVRRSFDGLMDHALPPAERERLRAAIAAALPAGATFHLLRTRQAGRRKFADFHLLVDGGLTVRAAHALAHELELRLNAAIPDLEISLHIEPIDDAASWESTALARLGEPATPPRE